MIKLVEKIDQWRGNPVRFVREVFGLEPDAWQVEFLEAYGKNRRIAASACKGPLAKQLFSHGVAGIS